MTAPRRRIVRPPAPAAEPRCTVRLQKLRARLEHERIVLAWWMVRLKRAFHRIEKQQRSIARLERQITRLEES